MNNPQRRRRWLPTWISLPHVIGLIVAVGLFLVLANTYSTYVGTAIAAAVSAAVGVGGPWAWLRYQHTKVQRILGVDSLGDVPEFTGTPAPVLTNPYGEVSRAYRDAAAATESNVSGQVVLIAGAVAGEGATTTSLNMAMAASRAGRRILLIDGDHVGQGLSSFNGSGSEPGLTDIASGGSSLREASRLWDLGDGTRLPMVPAGRKTDDAHVLLTSTGVADVFDAVTERADMVLIDGAPLLSAPNPDPLAAHADGTILVVTEPVDRSTLIDARARSADAGAPVVGFITNRVHAAKRSILRQGLIVAGLLLVGYLGYTGFNLWDSWRSVERHVLNTESARVVLPQVSIDSDPLLSDPDVGVALVSPTAIEDDAFDTFMVVGTDLGGARADVILLVLLAKDGSPPAMVSIPRDLYLPNRCTQGLGRVNANLGGCDDTNGTTLLALTIEDFTGVPVDHFALFDFDGFTEIIDRMGGIQLCFENPVRDWRADFAMDAGCHDATGTEALGWVRSRHTEQQINGEWGLVPGVNDLTRNQRQQDVVLALFRKLRSFDSPTDLAARVASLTDAFTLDDGLGIGDAIDFAWSLRNLQTASVRRTTIPVADFTTAAGAQVLIPTRSFDGIIGELFPSMAPPSSEAVGAS